MVKREVLRGPRGRVVVTDTVTRIDASDAGAVVVTGSHGGTSAAEFAVGVPLALVVFNDAGVGKEDAGIAGLARLQARGVAAATVAHWSARIGDAEDAWRNGVVSHVNAAAHAAGIAPGAALAVEVRRMIGL
jgi:hypothetical protein